MKRRLTTVATLLACSLLLLAVVGGIAAPARATTPGAGSAQQVVAWGDNYGGELGHEGIPATATRVAVQGLPASIQSLSAGDDSSLAADSAGNVWAWGQDPLAQSLRPTGTTLHANDPIQLPGLSDIRTVTSGTATAGAITNSGQLFTWGQIRGDGSSASNPTPYAVGGLPPVQAVSTGGWHWIALGTDGTVWTWGLNYGGDLGDGSTTDHLTPQQVTGLPPIQAVAAGAEFSVALDVTGHVWTWGLNDVGELGQGIVDTPHESPTPAEMPGLDHVSSIAAGFESALALRDDHTVDGWGCLYIGVYQGNCLPSNDLAVPMHLPLDGAVAISAGSDGSAAVMGDGRVLMTANNTAGMTGGGFYDTCGSCYFTPDLATPGPVEVLGVRNPTLLSVGTGHVLALADVVTPPAGVNAPSYPTQPAISMDNGHFTVSWQPPADDGGSPITGYTVVLSGHYTRSDGTVSTYDPVYVGPQTLSVDFSYPDGTTFPGVSISAQGAGGSSEALGFGYVTVGYPKPSAAVTATPVGTHTIRVSWDPAVDNGSPVTRYEIYAGVTDPMRSPTDLGSVSGQSTTFDYVSNYCGLTDFAVMAFNQYGLSGYSSPTPKVTATCEPQTPDPPTATAGDGTATLSWTAPFDCGSPITRYDILQNGSVVSSTDGATTTATIGGLTNASYYNFSIVAVNAIGSSQASPTVLVRPLPPTLGPPTNVTATPAGDGQARVQWSPPASHPELVNRYYVTDAATGASVGVANDGATSVMVTGLTDGQSYRFVVSAIDNYERFGQASAPSNPVVPQASPQVPGVPSSPGALAGDGSVLLTWSAPASDGGSPITGYTVTVNPGGRQVALGAVTNTTLAGLANGTAYSFTVAAKNAVGTGSAVTGPAFTPMAQGRFHAYGPAVAYSTGSSPLVAGADRDVALSGLPATADSAVVTVHLAAPTAAGSLRVSTAGTNPATSDLTFVKGQSVTDQVTVHVVSGKLRLHLSAGKANISLDLVGYFTAAGGGDGYHPLNPGVAYSSGSVQLAAGADRDITIPGIPADTDAVQLSAHVISATANGSLRLSAGGTNPATSNLGYATGGNATGELTVRLVGGKVRVHLSAGKARIVLDLLGYYEPGVTGSGYHALAYPSSYRTGTQPLAAGADRDVTLAGLPAAADVALVTVHVTGATAAGDLGLSAAGTNPATSSIRYSAAPTVGEAMVKVVNGRVRLHLHAGKATVTLDLVGYTIP